jgi:hypothetical protein
MREFLILQGRSPQIRSSGCLQTPHMLVLVMELGGNTRHQRQFVHGRFSRGLPINLLAIKNK